MKIVFLGNFNVDYTSESHHAKSLEALGHTVVRLQEGTTGAEQIQNYALESDLFVWVHTHGWSTPTSHHGVLDMVSVLKRLKREGIPSLTYHLDLWMGLAREKDLEADSFYRHIEHFFTVDKLMADWFNENTEVKGHFLPAGVFGGECRMAEAATEIDVIFVGSRGYHPEWPYRPQLIDWLRDNYRLFRHVGGDGDTGTVRGQDLNRWYARAKIAVGDTLCKGFDYPYYMSDRIFETTGRGGFIIHPYIKGIEDFFEIDKEIVTYKFENFGELREKVDYYLAHDEEREAIRRAGHERTKRDHTYTRRWEEILATVAKEHRA
jgi:hypothetical protein